MSFAAGISFFAVGRFVKLPLVAAAIAGTVAWTRMAAAVGAGVGVLAFIASQREKQSMIPATACLAFAIGPVFRITGPSLG